MRGTPLFLPTNPFKEKVEIVGKSGTGKNVLLMELLKSCPYPYTLFDTLSVCTERGFQPTYPRIQKVVVPPKRTFFTEKPTKGQVDELQTLFMQTCQAVVQQTHTMLIVDETEEFSDKWWYRSYLKTVSNKGQNINVTLMILHQRPAQIHNDILSNFEHRFIFDLELEDDKKFFAKIIPNGRDLFFDRRGKGGQLIPAPFSLMPQHGFLYYNGITKQAHFCDPL